MTGIVGKIASRSKIINEPLTDGGVLLGSGAEAITATAALADGEMLVGDGTTDPAIESGATLRTSIGVGTGNAVTFTTVDATTDFTIGGLVVTDGNIADTGTLAIVPVDGCTIALGGDAGDDFNVDSGKLVVEGDTGRCGIGNAAPAALLHIEGNTPVIRLSDANSTSEADALSKNNGTTERMRIAPAGHVCTNNCLIVSDHDLQVPHSSQDRITYSMEAGGSQVWLGMYSIAGSNNGFRMVENGSVDWYIYMTGHTWRFGDHDNDDGVHMAQGANAWSAISSDERKKTDWVMFTDAVDKINTLTKIGTYKKIDPITGEYKNENQFLVGLSAQEIEGILPKSIIKARRPIDFFPDDENEYLTFSYQDVFVLAIKAIQELSTKNDALEARILTLESA